MDTIGAALADYNESLTTAEGYEHEDEAKAAFFAAFSATGCFKIFQEVECWYFGGSVFGDKPTGRIDFLMTPQKTLLDAGWKNGIVGIEVKKSGHKAGPLICQMIDYSKAVYRLPESAGSSLLCLSSVYSFPAISCGGTLGSIMANHRIGSAMIDKHGCGLQVCSSWAFRSHKDRGLHVVNLNCGYKNGSR
jgi:hypothetical protein